MTETKQIIERFQPGKHSVCDIFDSGDVRLQFLDPQFPIILTLAGETIVKILDKYTEHFYDEEERSNN